MGELTGRTFLVTGANTGIGLATATDLANGDTSEFSAGPTVDLTNAALVRSTAGDVAAGGGSFTDPACGPWTATVDYGDGSGAAPLALAANQSFVLAHRYGGEGNFTVTVQVTDSAGLSGSASFVVAVFLPGIDLSQAHVAEGLPGQVQRRPDDLLPITAVLKMGRAFVEVPHGRVVVWCPYGLDGTHGFLVKRGRADWVDPPDGIHAGALLMVRRQRWTLPPNHFS